MGLLDFIYTGVIAHFLKKRLGGSGHHSAHDHHDHAHEHHGVHEDYDHEDGWREDYDHEDSWREDEALDHGDHDLDDVIYNKYIHEDYDHDDFDQGGYDHDSYGEHELDGWYGDKY